MKKPPQWAAVYSKWLGEYWFKPSGEAANHAPSKVRAGGLQISPDLRRSAASPDGSVALLDAQGFGACCPRGSQVVISKSPGKKKPTEWWAEKKMPVPCGVLRDE
jgi:hypothetical protein